MVYVAIIIVIIIIVLVWAYNSLVMSRNKVKQAWSDIDTQLQRRFDLIPNLVETVKGYASHEEKILTDMTNLRTSWENSKTVSEKSELNGKLSKTFGSVIAIAENYPDLKASQNFKELQVELSSTETKIATARENYNSCVNNYNTMLETIPTNIVASMFKFSPEELFKLESPEAKENVKVQF